MQHRHRNRYSDGHSYRAHEALVRFARLQPALWRLLLGLVLVAAVSFAMTAALQVMVAGLFPGAWLQGLGDGSTPGAMLVLLGSFAFLSLGVAMAARLFHQRSFATVTGHLVPLVWQFGKVSLYLLGLSVLIMLLPPYSMGPAMTPNLPVWTWLGILPLSIAAVLVQTSAEEILFRGYIQQALAARFRSPAVWLLGPSALFALGHYLPAEAGENALLITVWAGLFGVLMADLTARAGTLGPAMAVHFFNNVTALLLFASPTSLNGLALYLIPFEMADVQALRPWMAVDFALMLVSWLCARLAIRR
ncbi:CPBP family intramembrane metalloprotease [Leisingera sp. M527]|uniref:CPBP family intramembrane glutamic endopeptidase n=1 Tax=unclassified Leisingera TaxID=2614906 RepID=UPI0021A86912|nr:MULTISPECIES: CPBP family intramembrane glutamic endopeptidase [unclassified Leisingera]UWQ32571.1 CPBP family intramembrane metalloprotease [Leisingera sp. M527]UWQ74531.1 CPBP family intramembrane metalloprotease [Leisingera sp. M658]